MTNDNNNPMYRPAYEDPIWNASHIGSIPIDLSHKKDGWGFLMNKGKFEMFPIGDESFYDHNKLKNYNADEHVPLSDTTASTRNLWSAKKTKDVIEESRLTSNKTLNKAIKDLKEELGGGKDFKSLLNGLESAENDLSVIKNVLGDLSASQPHNVTYTIFQGEITKLEGKLVALVNQSLKKTAEKTEINKKFKEVEKTIKEIDKAFTKSGKGKTLSDKEILKLIEDRALWGHEHLSKEIKHDGQRLSEYLETISVGDSLPDQAGNSGKFLTTDGSDASWASLPGGGDMAAATYDPTNKSADAFNVDNHASGSTNKVYTATEQSKLSGIEDNADVTDAGNVGSAIHGVTGKNTPVDADTTALIDSAASNVLKKVTWANIKATLKSYFDSIYQAAGSYITASSTDTLTNKTIDANGTGNSITNLEVADLASGVLDTDLSSVAGTDTTLASAKAIKAALDGKSDTSHSHTLDGLSDVTISSPSNGQVIKYNGSGWVNDTDATGAGGVSDGDKGDITVSSSGATWTIDSDVVTYEKLQDVSATNRILGRKTSGAGNAEELSASDVRTLINVEDGADVTDTTNVTAAGALMDSEVDADLKTLSLPANTTISTYAASFLDDANEATFKATVNLEIGTDVQAFDANNATASSTTTFTNKTIDANGTGNSISNLEVADFAAAAIVTEAETIAANDNDTTIPTSAAVKAYADSVGGGAAPGTLVVFRPSQNEPPSSNFATIDLRNLHPVLDFDASTNESAVFSGIMPSFYGGGGVTVYIHYAMTSATSGDIDWDVAFERIGDQQLDIDSDSFAAVNSVDNTTVPGTSGLVDVVGVAFTDGADMDSVAAGEGFRIKVTRDAAADTATGDAELLFIEIRESS